MKIGILQCDTLLEKLQPKFGSYTAMIQRMLATSFCDCTFETIDCYKQEYPEDLAGYDLFVISGSRASVYDRQPWILRLINFVRRLDQEKKKLLGICFGHQLIAVALGGEVEKAKQGWGLGVATNRVIASPAWMQQHVLELRILVSHQDQVTKLVKGAQLIAESDFCPYFMILWNKHFLSIQGHPEWERDYAEALLQERRGQFLPERLELGLSSLSLVPDNQLFIQWVHDFVNCQP